jgi:myo-inositol 2-dehydrogenase / D-chiro-inositol 1-dehydrogenase
VPEQSPDLRVAVIGVGAMGADHVRRLSERVVGARPVLVADASAATAERVAGAHPGVRVAPSSLAALDDDEVDAVVIASTGPTHAELLLACLERGLPVLCEKPMTTDVASALAVVRAEAAVVARTGRRLVQVGFMRRYDAGYRALRELVVSEELGAPLMLHCAHRNASVPPYFTGETVVLDSLVHEVDGARFLLGEEVTAIAVRTPRARRGAPEGLADPLFALLETASGALVDVEVSVATGLGYEVRTELVAERGTALVGTESGPLVARADTAVRGRSVPAGFLDRFAPAYDAEVQAWVDAARDGTAAGPSTWDGYAATAVTTAGVEALRTGRRVEVVLADRP